MSPRRDLPHPPPPPGIARRHTRLRDASGSRAGTRGPRAPSPVEVARTFVDARRAARSLPDFPGVLPADMAAGYLIQDAAIGLWPDEVMGWKVGRIPNELQAALKAD